MSADHYQPRRDASGTWGFKTAIGQCDGFLSRADAITAAALRKHFTPSAA